MSNGRKAAVTALLRMSGQGAYSNLVLSAVADEYRLDSREAAFAGALIYGVTERRLTLDYILSRYSKIKINKLDASVREILRTAVYQLAYMDKIPESAAVNEAVGLTGDFGVKSASGYVNAVLRAFIRDGKSIKLPDAKDFINYNSIKYSCPTWLIRRWRGQYGERLCLEILKASIGAPPVTARVNTLKTNSEKLCYCLAQEGITAVPNRYIPDCVELTADGAIDKLGAFTNGLFHIQDAASQLCCLMAGVKKGDVVADVCAAPGGKSFTLAQLMCNDGSLYSCDVYEHKTRLIKSGAKRLGIDIITTAIRDASQTEDDLLPQGTADLVLCDVPCSGLGIIRRKPEIKYKPKESLDGLPDIQRQILEASAPLVKKGGRLMFSTCTLAREENSVANQFLADHPEFSPTELNLPKGIEHQIKENTNELTVFPGIYGTDGFYFALMERKN